jgi:hypothetical protein
MVVALFSSKVTSAPLDGHLGGVACVSVFFDGFETVCSGHLVPDEEHGRNKSLFHLFSCFVVD